MALEVSPTGLGHGRTRGHAASLATPSHPRGMGAGCSLAPLQNPFILIYTPAPFALSGSSESPLPVRVEPALLPLG